MNVGMSLQGTRARERPARSLRTRMVGATGGGGANEPVYSRTSVCHPHATVSYRSVHRPLFPIVPYFCNCRWPLLRIAACGCIVVSLAVYARLVNKGHRSRCGSDTPILSNSGPICPSVSRETFSVLWQTPPGSVRPSIPLLYLSGHKYGSSGRLKDL